MEDGASAHLLRPRPTYRVLTEPYGYWHQNSGRTKHYQLSLGVPATYRIDETEHGTRSLRPIDSGQNPPDGVVVTYFLGEEATLTFMTEGGEVIRRLSSFDGNPRAPAQQGTNRFVWDMKHERARRVEGESEAGRPMYVPIIPPGTYRVRLQVGDEAWEEQFEVLLDPRVTVSQEELERQHELLITIRDKVSESSDAVGTVRSIAGQIQQWAERSTGETVREVIAEAAEGLREKLSAIEDELLLGSVSSDTPMRGAFYARGLRSRLASLGDTVGMADGAPTRQSYEVYEELSSQIDAQLDALHRILDEDIQAFNSIVRELDLSPVVLRVGGGG